MSDEMRKQIKEQQLQKYYVEPFVYTPTPLSSPTEDYNPFQQSSKSESIRKEKNALRNKEKLTDKRSFRTNIIE